MPEILFLSFKKSIFLLALLSFFFLKPTQAQQTVYQNLIFQIDSLASEGLAKSALTKVKELDSLSRKNRQPAWQIKAAVYRMTFQSYLEENALPEIISNLKKDIQEAEFPVKPVLQSILAETFWKYYKLNRYTISQRSRIENQGEDFTRWDISTLVRHVHNNYKLSLQQSEKLQQTEVEVFREALTGDSSTRTLRPSLYDLLAHRALSFYLEEEASLSQPAFSFSINNPGLFSDGEYFSKLTFSNADTASMVYQGLKLLQELSRYHLSAKANEAMVDLDLKRLEFVYRKAVIPGKDSLYLRALEKIAKAYSSSPLSADALFKIGQFYRQKDSLMQAVSYLEIAKTEFPKSIGGENAAKLIKEIKQKRVLVGVEDLNIPNKPILALLNYRNVEKLHIAIYEIAQSRYAALLRAQQDENWYYGQLTPTPQVRVYLKRSAPVQRLSLYPPQQNDYKEHRTEFKINPLNPGRYLLMIENEADSTLTGLTEFQVSNLSFVKRVNADSTIELRVMHRDSGLPLNGISVKVSEYMKNTNRPQRIVPAMGKTDQLGRFVFKAKDNYNLFVQFAGLNDSLTSRLIVGGAVYSQTNAEQLAERTILFTDRQIYRPGQTVYFKGLHLKQEKGQATIVSGKTVSIDFKGANNQTIASQVFKTNEFGTFSGSFIIPQSTLNGAFRLSSANGRSIIRVEEYKRPSFFVNFKPVKETYRLNDSVFVRGTVTAFAGYGLTNATVTYTITRRVNPQNYHIYGEVPYNRFAPATIASETLQTGKNGDFKIAFKAAVADEDKIPGAVYMYTILASVTDASGETRTASASVSVGDAVIRVNAFIKPVETVHDSLKIALSLNNINGQAQNGTIRVRIFALQHPGKIYKKRLWGKPDTYILDTLSFKKDFPDFAYRDEDDIRKWQIAETVFDQYVAANGTRMTYLSLSGMKIFEHTSCLVEVSAKNTAGDTCSAKYYTTFVLDKPDRPSSTAVWAFSPDTKVKKGEKAVFYLGIGKPASVLVEVVHDAKIVSSQRLELGNVQKSIAIPYNGEENLRVQFLLVADNRLYHFSKRIIGDKEERNLDIRFLTFRDKLQPGEQEQWKLQVSSKDKKADAELLATLYDASLNSIYGSQSWSIPSSLNYSIQDYYNWSGYDFVHQQMSRPFFNSNIYFSHSLRQYERLDMNGYSYYGGNNYAYRTYLKKSEKTVERRKDYDKNAAKVKTGYDVIGRVMDNNSALSGVSVAIQGMTIRTSTDENGYFRIKVPYHSVLIFSHSAYFTKNVSPSPGQKLVVNLTADPVGMEEVVIIGYGTQRKADFTGSVASIQREEISTGEAKSGIIEDYAVYNFASIEAPQEVLKENIIRKNFSETAFFYPHLRTNERGEVSLSFTIPEALTRWQFKALAHTKDLQSGYLESEIITQKELMVDAHTPRFLREGDTVILAARITNLQSQPLKAKITLQLFDGFNLQPVKLLLNPNEARQSIRLAAAAGKTVFFKITVPTDLEALVYRLTATGGKHQDGEENILPVLPQRILVTEAMPIMVKAGQQRLSTLFQLSRSRGKTLRNKTLMLEYFGNPVWYAVQALPYLMESPYECSEQVFSRYYANSLGTAIVRQQPLIKKVFNQWKNTNSAQLLSNLEKNQELKALLIEETPWLKDAVSESEQKKRIALLFDLNKMEDELNLNLEKLNDMQLPDGSFPWFTGANRGDRFITQHILAGIGQLYQLNIADTQNEKLKELRDRLLKYVDRQLIAGYKNRLKTENADSITVLNPLVVHAWYVRSYFRDLASNPDLNDAFAAYLAVAEKQWKYMNVYEQALSALIFQRCGKLEITQKIIKSLKEKAKYIPEIGRYWPNNGPEYFWYRAPIETQVALIELFTEAGGYEKDIEEMKMWLLHQKQVLSWKSTKATAAVCYALLMHGENWLEDGGSSEILIGNKPLSTLKPEIKADARSGYIKAVWQEEQIKPEMANVIVKNNGKATGWGAVYWQYFQAIEKIHSMQAGLRLERKYFIQHSDSNGPVLIPVGSDSRVRVGDVLKVVIYLSSDRNYEYVQLKDMRPSGTEPTEILSGHKFQDGLYYYQVTKDAATNFFISQLRKGNYVFEYSLRVSQAGSFSSGISTVQSMYAPQFNAHSEGARLIFKNQE